jgi:hypothetical protein
MAILSYVKSQGLHGFIDGSVTCPPHTILSQDKNVNIVSQNHDWLQWHMHDQLLLSALISSLTEKIIAHVVKCTTTWELWVTLEKMFTSHSCTRTMQIHYQLATLKRGNLSIANYFHKFTSLVDTLATTEQPLNDFDLISFILASLGSEYNAFVTSVTTRLDPVSLEELYGHILAHENKLEQQNLSLDLIHAGANFASKSSLARGHGRGPSNFAGRGNSYSTNFSQNHGRGRGRSNQSFSKSSRLICQVCQKASHVALNCYHRFDNAFQSEVSSNMQAYLTSSQTPIDYNWCPDSSVTHHLIFDLANLNVKAEKYFGTYQIKIGNGTGLSIQHTRTTHLSTPNFNFHLLDVLHVPNICKNLISIQKFTQDTNTFFEFHPSHFLLKDRAMEKLLLHDPSNHVLYLIFSAFNKSHAPSALVG